MKYLKGSVMEPETFAKLQRAKHYIEAIKDYKLEARHQKNTDKTNEETKLSIFKHIQLELDELKGGFMANNVPNILEELADIENCCDILAMMFLEE